MNRIVIIGAALAASTFLAACSESTAPAPTQRDIEARKSAEAANELTFTANAERENIKGRLKLTSNPGQLGFIMLINEMGQPIMYEGVKGKITSSGKRLTPPQVGVHSDCGSAYCDQTRDGPSDEGTYGRSDEYVYYWNTDGAYRQWNGKYLYSDQPFRTRVEPLVITTK